MNQEITIYKAGSGSSKGTLLVLKNQKKRLLSQVLSTTLLISSILIFLLFSFPFLTTEINYRLFYLRSLLSNNAIQTTDEQRSKFSYVLSPNDNQFELIIPKIGIHTQVLANVNPLDEEEYNQILGDQAAHAQGSALPGDGGLVYLFGHSTNSIFNLDFYNPVFYLLKDLQVGDEIGLLYKGKVHLYQVQETKIVAADNLEDIRQDDQEKLILQTCWPPGTAWKRLLVISNPIT